MGLLHQFLPPNIGVLREDMVTIGRAIPVLDVDFLAVSRQCGHSAISAKPFGLAFEALDRLGPGVIYVASLSIVGRVEVYAGGASQCGQRGG